MHTITIIDENGRTREQPVADKSFAVRVDGQLREPALTTEVEWENDGDNSATRDMCGNLERQRNGDSGWLIRVEGIVTKDDSDRENLSLQMLRDVISQMEEIEIVSDIGNGTFEVSNVLITDSSDLVSFRAPSDDEDRTAFDFQLQLGESQSSE